LEALNQLVANSLARHGMNRPVDPRRLQWSRWFLCDSPHSLLVVPSKPGIIAVAEEISGAADAFVRPAVGNAGTTGSENVGTTAPGCPTERSSLTKSLTGGPLGGAAHQRCDAIRSKEAASAAEVPRRMLAVLQFSEADNMARTLDRMFTRPNPVRELLASGRCFLRFVALEDQSQRQSICATLNQWLLPSAVAELPIPSAARMPPLAPVPQAAPMPQPGPIPHAAPWKSGASAPR
jgi:hypothetical protein